MIGFIWRRFPGRVILFTPTACAVEAFQERHTLLFWYLAGVALYGSQKKQKKQVSPGPGVTDVLRLSIYTIM